MKPIEAMADAWAKEHNNFRLHYQCSTDCRQACARAALLALADVELPEEMLNDVEVATGVGRKTSEIVIRTALRSIASEGESNG